MKKILFAVDFRHPVLPIAMSLADLAPFLDSEFVFLFVVDRDEVGFNVTTGFDAERVAEFRENARLRFKEWEEVLAARGVRVSHRIEIGSPEGEILEAAHSLDAELIVIGRRPDTPIDDFYPWGLSMKIVRRTSRPILINKWLSPGEKVGNIFERVLYATDFSEAAENTGKFLHFMAEGVRRIDVANVIAPHADSLGEAGRMAMLEKICGRFRALGIEAHSHLRSGDPAQELLALAEEIGATMLASATTGKSGILELLSTCVSHRLADKSPIPVLLVPAQNIEDEYGKKY